MTPTVWISFVAGLVSFFSPCVLPLYPSYLSYLSGVSLRPADEQLLTWRARIRVVSHALFFMLGFSVIFFALGLSASALGRAFSIPFLAIAGAFASLGRLRRTARYSVWISRVSGYLLVLMGILLVTHGIERVSWAAQMSGKWV